MSKKYFGESMAEFDRHSDEQYWIYRYKQAIAEGDNTKIEELLAEDKEEGYEVPVSPSVVEVIKKQKR